MRRVAAAGLIAVTGGTTAVAILDDAADRRLRHAARTLYASSAGAGIAPCWLQAIQKYLHSRERDDDAVPSVAADDVRLAHLQEKKSWGPRTSPLPRMYPLVLSTDCVLFTNYATDRPHWWYPACAHRHRHGRRP